MTEDLLDRWTETVLQEACDGLAPPDLADRVVARAAAVPQPNRASRARALWPAALILLGGAVVVGVASLWPGRGSTRTPAAPRRGQEPTESREEPRQDPEAKIVVPRSLDEFRKMLGDVRRISVQALIRETAGRDVGSFDLEPAGRAATVELSATCRDNAIRVLRDADPTPVGWAGDNPDTRVFIELTDDRIVRCTLRSDVVMVNVDGCVTLRCPELYPNCVPAFVNSHMLASAALGFVGHPIELGVQRRHRLDRSAPTVHLGQGFYGKDLPLLLPCFDAVRHLDLTWSKVAHADFADWPADLCAFMAQLERFTFRDPDLDDAGLDDLATAIPELRHLDLSHPADQMAARSAITGEGLTGFAELRHLELAGHDDLTDRGLRIILGLPRLEELDLTRCGRSPLTLDGYASLRSTGGLRRLALGHRAGAAVTTDAIVPHISGLVALESLSFAGSDLTADGLRALRDLPLLRELDLSSCVRLDDAAAAAIGGLVERSCRDLRHLDVRGEHKISGDALARLAQHGALHVTLSRSAFEADEQAVLQFYFEERLTWR